jgi:Mitochondrial K+-H+ exchange-related
MAPRRVRCSWGVAVNVFLLTIEPGWRVFYAEVRDAPAKARGAPPRRGLRGWLDRLFRRWHLAGRSIRRKGGDSRLRRAWHWLQRRLAPDEAILKHLGRASQVELYHPASMGSEEALGLWRDYLARRRRRHLLWLVVTLVLSLLSVLLMVLPGPNVLGYWFVYRAICHLRVEIGTRRVLGNRIPTRPHPTAVLEAEPAPADGAHVTRVARMYGLRKLDEFLLRAATEPDDTWLAPSSAPQAVSPRAPTLAASDGPSDRSASESRGTPEEGSPDGS